MTEEEYMTIIRYNYEGLFNGLINVEEFLNKMVQLAIQLQEESK